MLNAHLFTFTAAQETQTADVGTPGEIIEMFVNHTLGASTVTINVVVDGIAHLVKAISATPSDERVVPSDALTCPPGGKLQVVSGASNWTGTVLVVVKN
jgi:hypothetical protein